MFVGRITVLTCDDADGKVLVCFTNLSAHADMMEARKRKRPKRRR